FLHDMAGARFQEAQKSANIKQLSAKLTSDNDVKIPNWLTLSEAQYLTKNANVKWETLADLDKDKYFKMAESNVRLALVLDKIRENEPDAQLTDEEVLNMIKQTLAKGKNQKEVDDTVMELNKSGYLSVLAGRMRDEHTLDFVLNNCKIIE
ncbi:MAG TPA: hypothetical protein VNW06_10640, partial [Cytophagaceae bacterium]|nr:hypothetical protein [Cytophagaceae bacterium]